MVYAAEQEPLTNWITRINQRVSERDFKDRALSYAYSITSFMIKLLGLIFFKYNYPSLKSCKYRTVGYIIYYLTQNFLIV